MTRSRFLKGSVAVPALDLDVGGQGGGEKGEQLEGYEGTKLRQEATGPDLGNTRSVDSRGKSSGRGRACLSYPLGLRRPRKQATAEEGWC